MKALETRRQAWIDGWNENPRPFTWTKTADEILNSLINPPTTGNQQETQTRNFRHVTRDDLGHGVPVLQPVLSRWVVSSVVVADAGLGLASSAPVVPVQGEPGSGGAGGGEDDAVVHAADL
ncbi:hypothetical protein WKI67_41995, partial [Streptomyces sp. MS2.AVA.5]